MDMDEKFYQSILEEYSGFANYNVNLWQQIKDLREKLDALETQRNSLTALNTIFDDIETGKFYHGYGFVSSFDVGTKQVVYSDKPSLSHKCSCERVYPVFARQEIEGDSSYDQDDDRTLHTLVFSLCPDHGVNKILEKQQTSWGIEDLVYSMRKS